MDILSIVLGVLSLATAFTPLIWLQVVGGFVGIAGIVLARKAKKAAPKGGKKPAAKKAAPKKAAAGKK